MLQNLHDQYAGDAVLMEEIELLTEIIIAASDSRRPLSQDEIDHVLGVDASSTRSTRPAGPGPR